MEAVAKQTCQVIAVAVVAQVAGTAFLASSARRFLFQRTGTRKYDVYHLAVGEEAFRTSGGIPGAWEKCPQIWILGFSPTMTRSSPKSDLCEPVPAGLKNLLCLVRLYRIFSRPTFGKLHVMAVQ